MIFVLFMITFRLHVVFANGPQNHSMLLRFLNSGKNTLVEEQPARMPGLELWLRGHYTKKNPSLTRRKNHGTQLDVNN
jgi:hypothetical protein